MKDVGLTVQTRALLLISGLVFGAMTSAINHGFGPAAGYLSKIIGNGGTWLLVGFLACVAGTSWRQTVGRGVFFYLPATLAYYVSDVVAGVYSSATPAEPSAPVDPSPPVQIDAIGAATDLIFYMLVSLMTSCVLAVVVKLVRRGGFVGAIAGVAVPVYIAFRAWNENRGWAAAAPPDQVVVEMNILITVIGMVVAVIVVLLQLARSIRTPRTSSGGENGAARIKH